MEVLAEQSKYELNTVSEHCTESSTCRWLQWQITKCTLQKSFMNKVASAVFPWPRHPFFLLALSHKAERSHV